MDAHGNAEALDNGGNSIRNSGSNSSGSGSSSGNSKTALVLLSVALVFFLGVIASHILFG